MQPLLDFVCVHWFTLLAALINFLWVYLEYRASMWLWPVGIVLPLCYIVVSYEAQFYGNVAINVYYLATSIIGWYMWLRGGKESDGGRIARLPWRGALWSLCLALPTYALGVWLLGTYTDSILPWADALATVISFVGMIWLAKKWREHWLCWVSANLISSYLFYLSGDAVSTVVFIINFAVAILGYRHWIALQKAQDDAALS